MPKVSFSPENRRGRDSNSLPLLKIDKKGEYARILIVEEPEEQWVHKLQMPKLVEGRPSRIQKTRLNGTQYETYEYDYIGSPVCLGHPEILSERGSDPANCPVCALADEGDMVIPPIRRFAMHVIVYGTVPGSSNVSNPFSVSLRVWKFNDRVFSRLVDLQTEWGDLSQHDLLLTLSSEVIYQQYDVGVSAQAAWKTSEATKKLVEDTYGQNKLPDLTPYCGRVQDREWLNADLDKIKARWKVVAGSSVVEDTSSLVTASVIPERPNTGAVLGLDDLLPGNPGMGSGFSL